MTKSEIISHLAGTCDVTKQSATAILEEVVMLTYKEAKKGDGFTFPGIGKFSTERRKARMGRNPATGEAIKIPAKKVVKFKVAKALKDGVTG